jgi:hypothetical protein
MVDITAIVVEGLFLRPKHTNRNRTSMGDAVCVICTILVRSNILIGQIIRWIRHLISDIPEFASSHPWPQFGDVDAVRRHLAAHESVLKLFLSSLLIPTNAPRAIGHSASFSCYNQPNYES